MTTTHEISTITLQQKFDLVNGDYLNFDRVQDKTSQRAD